MLFSWKFASPRVSPAPRALPVPENSWARHGAFVARCSAAALLSYELAGWVGLPHPVWAAISGIIVSQERLTETTSATIGRLSGTVVGIAVAVAVGSLLDLWGAGVAVQMTCAVAVSAALARRFPLVRVAMWTAPIVFLTDPEATPLVEAGLWRGAEVMVGGLVGAALHWGSEQGIARLRPSADARESEPAPPSSG
ncbi:FUSC family protein [Pararhodospirillum oryzae]|uniref:Integral membrane bound transporter domain-containing protein n=1 Tax=Pararhodospirillum oryzae TaxID=478448 RepID=A0A512HC36_9PROT|nr:FUSC family protein [Pararhodospirillum oryzae]GEO83004.1 hypothetical protein ROR02_31350 [Pararhodospirillum oryzae]